MQAEKMSLIQQSEILPEKIKVPRYFEKISGK